MYLETHDKDKDDKVEKPHLLSPINRSLGASLISMRNDMSVVDPVLVQRDRLMKHWDHFWPLIFSNTGWFGKDWHTLFPVLSYKINLIFLPPTINPSFTFSTARLLIKIQNTLWQGIHEIEGCRMIYLYLKFLLFLPSVTKCRVILSFIWFKLSRQVRWSQKCRLRCPVAFLNQVQYNSQCTTLKELLEQIKWSETRWR